jgi:hypothetical protein
MKWIQRNMVALVLAVALSLGLAVPAAVQAQAQAGLVNVSVGNVNVLNNVSVGVAAQLVAQVCGVEVGPVVLLGVSVIQTGQPATVCQSAQGPVTIFQP